jgi:hypothetical protein
VERSTDVTMREIPLWKLEEHEDSGFRATLAHNSSRVVSTPGARAAPEGGLVRDAGCGMAVKLCPDTNREVQRDRNRQLELFRDAVLFVLRTEDAIYRVRCAAAGFVVMTDLHLAQKADGQQVQPAEKQA